MYVHMYVFVIKDQQSVPLCLNHLNTVIIHFQNNIEYFVMEHCMKVATIEDT